MLDIIKHETPFGLSIATFFDSIDRMFFTPDFETYAHLPFFNSPTAFKYLVIGIYLGLVLASICMYYNKNVLGGFVRKLDAEGCLSEQSAKTLDELSYGKNVFVKWSLSHGKLLNKVIRSVDKYKEASPDEPDQQAERSENSKESAQNSARVGVYPQKFNVKTDKFYLIPEKRDLTIQRFRAKGSGWLSVLLLAVVGLIAVVLVFKLAPTIVGMLDNALDGFSSEPDVLN